MSQKNNPQSERRAALDAAIAALDSKRMELQHYVAREGMATTTITVKQSQIDEINRHIRILSDMREEGPLL